VPAPEPPAVVLPPPYVPFPVACLPAPVQQFVVVGAQALQVDPALIALPALTALGAAVGTTRVLELKPGWTEPPLLWTVVVAKSGTGKTPALQLALRPVLAAEVRYHAEYQRRLAAWDTAPEATRAPRPRARRGYCQDTTIEAIADILADNPRGILVGRDEFDAWIDNLSRYRSAGSDVAKWLELYSIGTLSVDRRSRDRQLIPGVAVALTGGIQPLILRRDCQSRLLRPTAAKERWSVATTNFAAFSHRAIKIVNRLGFHRTGFDAQLHGFALNLYPRSAIACSMASRICAIRPSLVLSSART
jgi:hypothetical protein